jgi:hypothetical protein
MWACSEKPTACFDSQVESAEVFQSIHFLNCSSDSDQYEWDFGDGNTSTDVNPIHAYAGTGTFLVSLRAMSNFGGSEDLITRELFIENPSEKFIGRYEASFGGEMFLLKIEAGNNPNSIVLYIDDKLFCNATCRMNIIEVNPQNYWTDEYSQITMGSGVLEGTLILISLLVEDVDENEHLLTLSAYKINL